MSMCLYLKAGSELELARLARDGEALANIAMSGFGGGSPAAAPIDEFTVARLSRKMEAQASHHGPLVAQLMKAATERFQKRLAGRQTVMAGVSTDAAANDSASGGVLDLHKSWHVLHFLFTGSAEEAAAPGGALLAGGREIGDDLGYGPARLLDPAATKEFATFLATLSLDRLTERLNVNKMRKLGVYGVAGDDPDADELKEEVAGYFPMLQDYVEKATARGEGILVWMM